MIKFVELRQKFPLVLCLAVIVFQLFQIVYLKQSDLSKEYDVSYWKDRFEHSQWQLPLSKRIIGDDGLYAYAGYKLISGSDPAVISPEVPPVGKYIFGVSILLFNNPVYASILFGVSTLILFYFLCKKLFASRSFALFLTTVLFLDPLFFSNLTVSSLDIVQLFFLLATLTAMLFLNNKNYPFALISGLSLGLFAQTKFPILLPTVFIIELIYLFKKRFLNLIWIYILGLLFGFLAPYIVYFSMGNSFIDFLRLEKYVLSFYLKSRLVAQNLSVWMNIFLGKSLSINSSVLIQVKEYSLLWPIVTISSLASIFFIEREKSSLKWVLLWVFIIVGLIIFTLIPFYTRYLMLLLPFMYILSFFVIQKLFQIKNTLPVLFIIIFLGLLRSTFYLIPTPDIVLSDFYYNLSNSYFQDIYQQDVSNQAQIKMSREDFLRFSQSVWSQETIRNVKVEELKKQKVGDKLIATIKMTYFTQDLGKFEEEKSFYLAKDKEEWKIIWNWNILSNDFTPGDTFYKNIKIGKRGKIIGRQNKILVQDTDGFLISVVPSKIDTKKENGMLQLLSQLIYISPVHIQNAYLENAQPDEPVQLGTIFKDLSKEEKEKILSFPGVQIASYPTRIYDGIDATEIMNTLFKENDTRIYSSTNYHGIEGIEKEYDNQLSGRNGGKIVLRNKNGQIIRTIIKMDEKSGKDVVISL